MVKSLLKETYDLKLFLARHEINKNPIKNNKSFLFSELGWRDKKNFSG